MKALLTIGGSLVLLTLAFVVLRLAGAIEWSWWWVLAPLWGPYAVLGVILVATLIERRAR